MANIITSNEELNRFTAPALPVPRPQYDPQAQSQYNNILRLYFNQLDNVFRQLRWNEPVDYIDFNTTPPEFPHQTGRVNWDALDAVLR